MLTQTVLAKVEGGRLQKAVEGLVSGAYTATMIHQEPEWLSGYVANGDGQRYATTITPTLTACSYLDFMHRARAAGYICKHHVVLALHVIRTPKAETELATRLGRAWASLTARRTLDMAHSHTPQSHPICPTCQSDLSDRKELAYFVSSTPFPVANDDVSDLYEETSRLVRFLGALAQAGPLAVVQEAEETSSPPSWLSSFVSLAEELEKETERRLLLLRKAGGSGSTGENTLRPGRRLVG